MSTYNRTICIHIDVVKYHLTFFFSIISICIIYQLIELGNCTINYRVINQVYRSNNYSLEPLLNN